MKHKKLLVSLISVFTVIIFFAIFLLAWFFGDFYKDFKNFKQGFDIPGLDEGAVPQGMTAYTCSFDVVDDAGKTSSVSRQYFFISAYMNDNSPSRIYVICMGEGKDETEKVRNGEYVGYVTLKNTDGSDFYGHCGGIATNGYTLWITGESTVYVAKASAAYSATNNSKLNITREVVDKAARIKLDNASDIPDEDYDFSIHLTASFAANCNASFCYYYDDPTYTSVTYDKLYVGEFYREGNYETAASHRILTPTGYQNTAFMYEYSVTSSSTNKYGLTTITQQTGLSAEDLVPKIQKIFSLPEKIQGMAFSGKSSYSASEGIMVLSQSYGLANSHLLCFDYKTVYSTSVKYNKVANVDPETGVGENFVYEGVTRKIGDNEIAYTDPDLYLYYVDKGNAAMFVNDYSIPSMTEGLCVVTPTTSGYKAMTRVYVLFESASKKYKNFVRQPLNSIYSFVPKAR